MNILITGANGFVGERLAYRLLQQGVNGDRVEQLTLLSRKFANPPPDSRVQLIKGDIADTAVLSQAISTQPDLIFHLACVPGGASEANFELGKHVNLDGMITFLEMLRHNYETTSKVTKLVFSSSIAVYRSPLPEVLDESIRARPGLSYGAHKLIGEILIADYSRRGWIDGRSVRLPGIVSRPPEEAGHASRFLSDIIRELAAGKPYICPAAPEAKSWLLSHPTCIDNLIRAAELPEQALNPQRQWQFPALHISMAELVDGIAVVCGEQVRGLINYQPIPEIQRIYASYPPLLTPEAEAAGFKNDGTAENLVRRALQD